MCRPRDERYTTAERDARGGAHWNTTTRLHWVSHTSCHWSHVNILVSFFLQKLKLVNSHSSILPSSDLALRLLYFWIVSRYQIAGNKNRADICYYSSHLSCWNYVHGDDRGSLSTAKGPSISLSLYEVRGLALSYHKHIHYIYITYYILFESNVLPCFVETNIKLMSSNCIYSDLSASR